MISEFLTGPFIEKYICFYNELVQVEMSMYSELIEDESLL